MQRTDLPGCPFCGQYPEASTISPNRCVCQTEGCPIKGVPVAADAWQKRPIEDLQRANMEQARRNFDAITRDLAELQDTVDAYRRL